MAITGFICHDDYLAKTAKLTDEEVGRLFRSLMAYHITGETKEIEGRESIAFDFIREDIDKAEQAYRSKCETNRRNRMLAIDNSCHRMMTNVDERKGATPIEENKIKENKIKDKVKRFTPPTPEEVAEYCRERNNSVNADRFVDFYASKGWRVGNQPMRDWKAAVRTWEKDDRQATSPKLQAQSYEQRDYTQEQDAAIERMMKLGGLTG